MSMRRSLSPSLAALMGAAAALTHGQAQSQATSESDTRVGYRFNEYSEDSFSGESIGDKDRYKVYSEQFQLDTRVSGGALDLTATHEVMSGSSPWYVVPGPDNRPIQVLSGATIQEHRSELRGSYTVAPGTSSSSTFSASYSQERDYRAGAFGYERSIPLTNALTLGAGGSISHDIIEPTDAALYDRVTHEEKNTLSAFTSLAWVIDKASVLQMGVQINHERGYLSDPYKLVSVSDDILPDSRPGVRTEAALLARYRHAFSHPDAALHLDYRYSQDSWGIAAHALEAGWYQNVGAGWQLIPSVRYYSQQQARFYQPFFIDGEHRFESSDYRLGTFGALSASLNVRKRIARWEFSAGIERYHAATDYALGGNDSAVPGVLSYTRGFVGLDYVFD
jgi:Protein of unknown function (DUF3570)